MSITNADITTRFPEFADVDTDLIDIYITDASLSINRDVFASKADLAHIYLSAHMLAVGLSSSATVVGGEIESSKVGDLARKYTTAQSDASAGSFAGTRYGQEYIRIRSEAIRGPLVITQRGTYSE